MNRREFMQALTLVVGASPIARFADAAVDKNPFVSVLSNTQRKMCAALSELIIPETDTPGAIAAGVPQFIDRMVSHYYSDLERDIFLDGLKALETAAFEKHQQGFLQCNHAQQTALLETVDLNSRDYVSKVESEELQAHDPNTPFFHKLKELSVVGYFSSKTGVENEMFYVPMPMEYKGDATLEDANNRMFIS
jgi:hypothetical protein